MITTNDIFWVLLIALAIFFYLWFNGFLNNPADIWIALLPNLLKKTLEPHVLQKPLFALVEEINHLRVFLDL